DQPDMTGMRPDNGTRWSGHRSRAQGSIFSTPDLRLVDPRVRAMRCRPVGLSAKSPQIPSFSAPLLSASRAAARRADPRESLTWTFAFGWIDGTRGSAAPDQRGRGTRVSTASI